MIKKQPNMNFGAAILFVIFSLLFFVLIYRFLTIQITGEAGGQPLAAKAKQKYMQEGVVEAKRGSILDRKGEVIAEETASYTLIAILDKKMTTNKENPKHVVDPEMTAKELAKYLDLEENEISRILKKDLFQVEFGKAGRDISHAKKKKIEELKLPGITFIRDSKRFYPNGIFSSHLIGFVERKENEDGSYKTYGKLGIEKTLNDTLSGKNGKINYQSDLWGYLLPDEEEKITPAQNGNNVYLTLDKKIQTFLEDAINKVDSEYKPKRIIAIVADPKTGDILAMGQRPTFHPKTREGIEKTWHNEAIENSFEPGSTMKIFTLAGAVQEKVFNPNEWYKSGSFRVSENVKPIHDHNYVGWGNITYLEGVQRSSNVAFAKIAKEKLGFEKLRDYLTKFGFDNPTGIDLPDETSGKIQFTYPIEKITTAFGQGSAVTPIQQIQAATAIANGGKMMKPHVIEKIVNPDSGEIVSNSEPEVVSTPISAETAKTVRDILETVVTSPKGTGNRYKIEGYSVAGKTGTAQIPGSDGKYLTGPKNYIFSFLGMAPKDDPKLIVYVAVQQPEIESYFDGSIPVSMIFNTVMKSSLQYLNIQPATMEKASSDFLADYKGKPVQNVNQELAKKGYKAVVLGNGSEIIGQLPAAGTKILEGEKVFLQTAGESLMPDVIGWSKRDVMQFAQLAELKLNSLGSGFVVKQNLQIGSKLPKNEYLIVELETPEQQFKKNEALKEEESKEKKDGEEETADDEVKD